MQIKKLLKLIEQLLPPETAMKKDSLGLQVESRVSKISSILITLEVNKQVIQEAKIRKANTIISFHPLIFHPLKAISESERVGSLVSELIRNDIALISTHTNFDAYSKGTSYILSGLLGLEPLDFLEPDEKYENYGMGLITKPSYPLSPEQLIEKVHDICASPVKFTEGSAKEINKIAVVGGSGSSFIDSALASGADAFITADITYHTFHQVNGKMWLIDPGHYEMEQFVPFGLAKLLKEELLKDKKIDIYVSPVVTNPVQYYPGTKKYKERQESIFNNFKI